MGIMRKLDLYRSPNTWTNKSRAYYRFLLIKENLAGFFMVINFVFLEKCGKSPYPETISLMNILPTLKKLNKFKYYKLLDFLVFFDINNF